MLCGLVPSVEFHSVHVASPDSFQRGLLEAQVREHLAASRVEFHFIWGDLTDQLLAFTAKFKTDLLLLGHRSSHSGRRSLARRLAMKAPCSIWMVPEGCPARLQRILIPIDFSRTAADSLSVATTIAELAGIEVAHALHVYFNQANVTYDEYDEIIRQDGEEAFRIFAARINLHGVDVVPRFEEGPNAAHTINRVADEIRSDLIVMGTRGRSRSAAVLLGSETEQIIMESRIPVLAVKQSGARVKLLQALRDKRLHERFT